MERFRKNVDVASKMHSDVHLFGGEACLHPEIESFLAACEDWPNNRFFLWTNGKYTDLGDKVELRRYSGSSHKHPRHSNVIVQVDRSKEGRDFVPTLVAPKDVAPLPTDRDYFTVYAQQHCFMWKYCHLLFYDDRAYPCECSGSFDRITGRSHGWEIKEGLLDVLTDEDVIREMEAACHRCGFCLPPDVRSRYVQKADKAPVASRSNYDVYKPYVL